MTRRPNDGSFENGRSEAMDPFDALRAQRPDDPSGGDAAAAADRVLARVALRIRSRQRRGSWWRWSIAGAALVVVSIGVATRVDDEPTAQQAPPSQIEAQAPAQAPDAWVTWVSRAVAGDAVARNRMRAGGRVAQAAALNAAEDETFADRVGALRLVRTVGPLQGEASIRRVARLVADPAVRETAVAVLARSLGSQGIRALGDALVAWPGAEAEIVQGLQRVVHGGRREAALGALLRGIQAGRVGALAASLDVAGPMGLPRVLAVMPPTLASHALVSQGVREASELVRLRLIRLAGRGSANALRLVGEARLPDAVGVLTTVASGTDASLAQAAVGWLEALDSVEGQVALARTMGASNADVVQAAEAALRATSSEQLTALGARARRSHRDRLAALRALGVAEAGVEHLEQLARYPRLFGPAADELVASELGEASLALSRLGNERHRFEDVLAGLVTRLRQDRPRAAEGLLALARTSDARAVLRALAGLGYAAPVFEAARLDPALAPHAEAVLREQAVRRERVGPRRRLPGVASVPSRRRSAI